MLGTRKDDGTREICVVADDRIIARISPEALVDDQDCPNAYLIAAAPRMLRALERMDALVESLWDSVNWRKTFDLNVALLNEAPLDAKRAILEAKGEGNETKNEA